MPRRWATLGRSAISPPPRARAPARDARLDFRQRPQNVCMLRASRRAKRAGRSLAQLASVCPGGEPRAKISTAGDLKDADFASPERTAATLAGLCKVASAANGRSRVAAGGSVESGRSPDAKRRKRAPRLAAPPPGESPDAVMSPGGHCAARFAGGKWSPAAPLLQLPGCVTAPKKRGAQDELRRGRVADRVSRLGRGATATSNNTEAMAGGDKLQAPVLWPVRPGRAGGASCVGGAKLCACSKRG